jgi:hypothetical protein
MANNQGLILDKIKFKCIMVIMLSRKIFKSGEPYKMVEMDGKPKANGQFLHINGLEDKL